MRQCELVVGTNLTDMSRMDAVQQCHVNGCTDFLKTDEREHSHGRKGALKCFLFKPSFFGNLEEPSERDLN